MKEEKVADFDQRIIFSHNLKSYMKSTGTTQKNLMDYLHLPSATISSWVNGKRMPRIEKIQMLADYFHISKSDLLEEVIIGNFNSELEAKAFQQKISDILNKYQEKKPLTTEEMNEITTIIEYVLEKKSHK